MPGVLCPKCNEEVPAGASRCPRDGTVVRPPQTRPNETALHASAPMPTPSRPPSMRPNQSAQVAVKRNSRLEDYYADAEPADIQPGTMVGEYEVTAKIGEGGMGQVYGAVHPIIGKRVAIKVLARHVAANRDVVRRFVAEARAVNQIGHRNIVDVFSFGQLEDGREYFVMEHLTGHVLEHEIEQRRSLPATEIVALIDQVLDALEAAHNAGIVHRDLKPDNIFLVKEPRGVSVKLLDFGIAKLSGEDSALTRTRTGVAMGTPDYMSPEQCRGARIDLRTDIYALGIILYRMFTGRFPFHGTSPIELFHKHMHETPILPSTIAAVDPAFERIIMKCVAKDPDQRFGSAREVADAMAAALAEARQAGVIVSMPAMVLPSAPPAYPPVAGAPSAIPAQTLAPAHSPAGVAPTPVPEMVSLPAPPSARRAWPIAVAVVAVAGAATVVAVTLTRSNTPEAPAPLEPTTTAPTEPAAQPAKAPMPEATAHLPAATPDAALAPATAIDAGPAAAAATGTAVIVTNLDNAVVKLDGKQVGTGRAVKLTDRAPGKYTVTVERKRYETITRDIEIVADKVTTETFELERSKSGSRPGAGKSGRDDTGKSGDTGPRPLNDKDDTLPEDRVFEKKSP